jgi:hypothetical protein
MVEVGVMCTDTSKCSVADKRKWMCGGGGGGIGVFWG